MRRPWNIINTPVYSLATYINGHANMNICTYVTAISLKPKMYAVAIYHNTKTIQNMKNSATAVLQLLSKPQSRLVRTLGKKTGLNYDKHQFLKQKACLTTWQRHEVLKDASAYILLEKINRQTTGDHDLFCFSVQHYKTQSENDILMFRDLIAQRIIL